MPFSEADFNDFLELLRSRPDLLVTARETLLGPEWQGIPAAIGRLSGQGQEILGRLDRVDTLLDNMDSRLGSVESQLGSVESRLDSHDNMLGRLLTLADLQSQATQRYTELLQQVAARVATTETQIQDVRATTQEILRRLPPPSDNGA